MADLMISVSGGQHCDEETAAVAEDVGRLIAEAGAVLVCGGLTGVMEAACRGATRAGGTTIGILPGTNTRDANQWVTFPIATGLGHARNLAVAATGDAMIAIDGEFGTLSEIAFASKLGIPVVLLQSWSVDSSPSGADLPSLKSARTPADAVAKALELASARHR